MHFELVDCGDDGEVRRGEESGEVGNGEVGDPN